MASIHSIIESVGGILNRVKSDKLLNNIFWNILARFGSAALSVITTLFLMSVLNVVDYGEYVVFFSIYSTIPFFFDFGLNNAFISFGAKLKLENPNDYTELISTVFSLKIIILIIICVGAIAGMIFNFWGSPMVIMTGLGAALGVWEFFITVFKSHQDFKLLSKLLPLRNLVPLVGILILYFAFGVESWLIYTYLIMLMPLVMSVVVFFLFFNKIELAFKMHMFKRIIKMSKWITLFTIVTALHSRTDIFLLEYFAASDQIDGKEVGIFSAAFSLLAFLNLVTSSFSEAVLPKISQESSRSYFLEFINRIKRTVPYVVSLSLATGLILYLMFSFGFNGKYIHSIDCMIFIGVGMIFLFYTHTLSTIFYPMGRTDMVFKIILLMFCINIAVGFLLIPIFGSIGAAVTNLLVSTVGLVFTILAINKIVITNGKVRI